MGNKEILHLDITVGIDNGDILKCLKKGFYSTIYLTEAVHFNPKYPEYHNVYISNIKDNLLFTSYFANSPRIYTDSLG